MALPLSFEFFPPKTAALEARLWEAFESLAPFAPQFASVTYGAGGSTRERTHAIVKRMALGGKVSPAAHLTCVAATREEVDAVVDGYRAIGVHHIVALRGDAPQGQSAYVPHPGGYSYALDLVRTLALRPGVEISVAAYPEKHPESRSIDADIDLLKAKEDAGATRAITQYFFDVAHYERFVARAQAAGVRLPIVPGVLPIHHFPQVVAFSARCGTSIPGGVAARFSRHAPETPEHQAMALDLAETLCRQLIATGAPGLHFYTLNRAELVGTLLARLDFPVVSR